MLSYYDMLLSDSRIRAMLSGNLISIENVDVYGAEINVIGGKGYPSFGRFLLADGYEDPLYIQIYPNVEIEVYVQDKFKLDSSVKQEEKVAGVSRLAGLIGDIVDKSLIIEPKRFGYVSLSGSFGIVRGKFVRKSS